MPSKPTIAFVPGAWFLPIQYKELTDLLEAAGYETIIQKNPSCDSADPFNADTQADADAVRNNVLLPLIAAGKEVVLIAHSYGGSPAAAAATGLSKGDMSAMGGAGGIIGLIWVAAFIAQEGESLQSKLPGGKLEPWHVEHVSAGFSALPSRPLNVDVVPCVAIRRSALSSRSKAPISCRRTKPYRPACDITAQISIKSIIYNTQRFSSVVRQLLRWSQVVLQYSAGRSHHTNCAGNDDQG